MKKLLLLSALALTLSCSKDEGRKSECTCDAKFVTAGVGYYVVPDLPVDCNSRRPNIQYMSVGGGVFYECEN